MKNPWCLSSRPALPELSTMPIATHITCDLIAESFQKEVLEACYDNTF